MRNHSRDLLKAYLDEVLGEPVEILPFEPKGLPFALIDAYRFVRVRLYGKEFVGLYAKAETENTPSSIRKHVDLCTAKLEITCVFIADHLLAYNRDRLIRQRVQFIVPGNQMFLPFLGLDLREYGRKQKLMLETEKLTPAAQATLLYLIIHASNRKCSVTGIAADMHYAKMTASRAADELEAASLVRTNKEGRERLIELDGSPDQIVQKALPKLQTPVRHTYRVNGQEMSGEYLDAGNTALVHFTDLSEPHCQTIAMTSEQWKEEGLKVVPDGDLEIEIWRYEPRLFARDNYAHPLLLYLCFRSDPDERVQIAIRKMMEEIQW